MVNGNYVKVNRKFIWSNGYFAFDGCHKFHLLEDDDDVKAAMIYGYRLYPDIELQKIFENSTCSLKYICNWKNTKRYVEPFDKAMWTSVKAPQKDIDKKLQN